MSLFLVGEHVVNLHDQGQLTGAHGTPDWQFADDYTVAMLVAAMSEDQKIELEEATDSFVYSGTNGHGEKMSFCEICQDVVFALDPKAHIVAEHLDLIVDKCPKFTVDENTGALMFIDDETGSLYILNLAGDYQTMPADSFQWTAITIVIDSTCPDIVAGISSEFNKLVDKAITIVPQGMLHVLYAELLFNQESIQDES